MNALWGLSRIRFRALWYIQVHPCLTQEKGLIHPILLCSPKDVIVASLPKAHIGHGQLS